MRANTPTFEELLNYYTSLQEQRALWETIQNYLIRLIPTDIGEPLEVIHVANSQSSVVGEGAINTTLERVRSELARLDIELSKVSRSTPKTGAVQLRSTGQKKLS